MAVGGGINAQILQIEMETRQAVLDAQRQAEDAMRMQQDSNLAAIGARALAEARLQDIKIAEMERARDAENKAKITAQSGGAEKEKESPVDALGSLFTPPNVQNPEAGVPGMSGIDVLGMPRGSAGGGPQIIQEGKTTAGTDTRAVSSSINFGQAPERTQTYEDTTQTNIPANAITGVSQQRSRRALDQPNALSPGDILRAQIQARYYDEQLSLSNRQLNYNMMKGQAELSLRERDLARQINNDLTKLRLERYDLFVGEIAKTGMLATAGDKSARLLYDSQLAILPKDQVADVQRRVQALRSDEAAGTPIGVWSPDLQQNILVSPLDVQERVGRGEVVFDKVAGGRKMTMTTPDGATFEIGPDNQGYMNPGTALSNEFIRNASATTGKLQRLEGLMSSTKDEYFGWGNRASNWAVSKTQEAVPGLLPSSMVEGAADYNVWKRNVAKNFNQIVFEQGGKTLTASEKQRTQMAELHENMDDVTFRKVMERDYQYYRLGLLRERIVAAGMLSDPKIMTGLTKSKTVDEFYDSYFGLRDAANWYRDRVELYKHKIQESRPGMNYEMAVKAAHQAVDAELGVMMVEPPAETQ